MSDLQMVHGTEILVSTLMLNKFLQRQFHRAGRHLQRSRCVQNCIFKFSQNQHEASGVLLSSQVTVSNSHFVLLSFHRDSQKHTERKNKPSWTEWIYFTEKGIRPRSERQKQWVRMRPLHPLHIILRTNFYYLAQNCPHKRQNKCYSDNYPELWNPVS